MSVPPFQAQLLTLWDEIGVPHTKEKQLHGRTLTIIGFQVNAQDFSISLPSQARQDLVDAIRAFVSNTSKRTQPLREWQHLIGWINWGLNICPLLRPALQSSYRKIAGKSHPHARVYLNKSVITDLLWLANHFETHPGVFVVKAVSWGPDDATFTVYCDASFSGLGFWCPQRNDGFMSNLPPVHEQFKNTIFWYEALTVLSALEWAAALPPSSRPRRLAIFTDNLNTVDIFDSFRADEGYNAILLRAADILIATDIDLRVWHVPGEENTIADALSRQLLRVVQQYEPTLRVSSFQPPRLLPLGDAQS